MNAPRMRIPVLPVVLAVAVLTGCSRNEGSASGGANGGTMIIAQSVVGGVSFPPFVTEPGGKMVQDLVYDRLAEISDDLNTVGDKTFTPRLAEKWTWAPDSLSIAFSINPKARWHDGKPVTASDVRYTFKIFTDSAVASSAAATLQNIDSVSVRDSLTAVVWFKKRTPEQFYDVAFQLPIFPEHVYGSIAAKDLRTSDLVRKPVGSGRFRFVSWQPDVRLELVADTANYRGRPKLDRIIVTKADLPSAAAQVLSGQADYVDVFPVDQAPKLDSNKFARGVVLPVLGYVFFGMNEFLPKTNRPHPIFSDIRLRRALSMSVDRVGLLRNVFGNAGRLGHGPFPATATYADTMLPLPTYDTTAAKALLDSIGWKAGPSGIRMKDGKPLMFKILVPTSSAGRMRYAVLLQEAFHRVGAQADLDQVDFPTFLARATAGEFDGVMGGNVTDPSPSGLAQQWGTAGIGSTGQNMMKYSNRTVDALFDSASSAFDQAKMRDYSSRAFKQVIDHVPAVWLYDLTTVEAVNRRITIGALRADAWWATVPDWSIPADKRIDRDRIGLSPAKP